jgi:hypothetical protein
MKYFKSLGLCLVAVFALSAVVASAAQAEENKGPLWIVGSPAKGLKTGETRAITSRTEAPPVLKGSVASVECEKATNKGVLLGGSPGTAFVEIKFEKCIAKGKPACTATGENPKGSIVGEIPVNVLVVLAFANGSRTSAVAAFAPEASTNLFSEFKFGSSAECGALKEATLSVTANGTAASGKGIKINGQERLAGQLAEVGMAEGSTFVLSTRGLTSEVGLLRLPETAITEAEIYNLETAKYEKFKAGLTAGALLGSVTEVATTQIETKPKEAFGWNY